MTWEETIQSIRADPRFTDLVRLAYLDDNLELNVNRFLDSEEWKETRRILDPLKPGRLRVLDMGCGNGISSVAFALLNHDVVAVDPDPSETVGTGAVRQLKEKFNLDNLEVTTGYAETVKLKPSSFDIVYCRQAMHHANNLDTFIHNLTGFLQQGGILFTVRDHIVWNRKDKDWFLETHPLHHYYGGENAYSPEEYKRAFSLAGLDLLMEIRHFDSVINYYPISLSSFGELKKEGERVRGKLKQRLGRFGQTKFAFWLYSNLIHNPAHLIDENRVPGRMYSYVLRKR